MTLKIREIIADITHVPVDRISETASHEDVPGWDSVAHINIMMTVENEFDATFTPEEMGTLTSVDKIATALAKRQTPRP